MKVVLLVLVIILSGCTTTGSLLRPHENLSYSNTMDIIRGAAELAPNGLEGQYVLRIKAVGSQGSYVYLNTEHDYRDQRAVTVTLLPEVVNQLTTKYGLTPQEFFVDKSISVEGEARRTRVDFISQGKRTDKYYYQTHIRVTDMSQINVVNLSA